MTPEHELVGALAEHVAAVVDDAVKDGDRRGMLSAIKELRDLVDTLPIRETREPAGGDQGDGSTGRAGHLALLTDPPVGGVGVGDSAHT